MFESIDAVAMEIVGEEGTLGDLLDVLSTEELDYLRNMKLSDAFGDPDDKAFDFVIRED